MTPSVPHSLTGFPGLGYSCKNNIMSFAFFFFFPLDFYLERKGWLYPRNATSVPHLFFSRALAVLMVPWCLEEGVPQLCPPQLPSHGPQ